MFPSGGAPVLAAAALNWSSFSFGAEGILGALFMRQFSRSRIKILKGL